MKRFAFIFPGQGSHSVGMLSKLATKYPSIKETFHEASFILDYDLWDLIQNGPAIELNKTWKTQPALLASSVSLWRVWKEEKGKFPTMMAGHSLGEYSALVCADALSFSDGVRLVKMRGKFMQEAVSENTGTMCAIIGLDKSTIIKICEEVSEGQVVSPANYNSQDQVVISGNKAAVERASIACKAAGARRVFPLQVSVPSHCVLMKPAAEKLAVELKKISFHTPIVSVINNVNAQCETAPEAIRDALIHQLYRPVQWTKTIQYMVSHGIENLYEVGPGRILTGLTKSIVSSLTASVINEPDALSIALLQCKENYHEF